MSCHAYIELPTKDEEEVEGETKEEKRFTVAEFRKLVTGSRVMDSRVQKVTNLQVERSYPYEGKILYVFKNGIKQIIQALFDPKINTPFDVYGYEVKLIPIPRLQIRIPFHTYKRKARRFDKLSWTQIFEGLQTNETTKDFEVISRFAEVHRSNKIFYFPVLNRTYDDMEKLFKDEIKNKIKITLLDKPCFVNKGWGNRIDELIGNCKKLE